MKNMHELIPTMLLALTLGMILAAGVASAQPSTTKDQDEMSFFLEELDKSKVDIAKLQADITGLQHRMDTDPNQQMRAEIARCQAFLYNLRSLRIEAGNYAPEFMARPMDWIARAAEQKCATQRQELAATDTALNKDRAEIANQIVAKRVSLKMATDIEATAQRRLQEIREERAQLKKSEDLKALAENSQNDHTASGEIQSGAKRAAAPTRKPPENNKKQQ
jgi:hypothetical protein